MVEISRRWLFLLLLPNVLASTALAGDVRWQEFLHFTRVETSVVDAERGHLLVLWEMAGLARFAGEVAVMASHGISEHRPDDRAYRGHVVYRFEDGSRKHAEIEGRITGAHGRDGNVQEGSFVIVGGTGRFDGIAGEGGFTATQYTATEAGGHTLVEVVARLAPDGDGGQP